MNAGYQTVKARILVAVLSVLMVFGNVASPLAGAFNVYADPGDSKVAYADKWSGNDTNSLEYILNYGDSGTTIVISGNMVADKSLNVDGKEFYIMGDNDGSTVYRAAGLTESAEGSEAFLNVKSGGKLTLGDNLTFTGKSIKCASEVVGYTVTFINEGGETDEVTVDAGKITDIVRQPTATKDGYEFLGWQLPDGSITNGQTVPAGKITGSMDVAAVWGKLDVSALKKSQYTYYNGENLLTSDGTPVKIDGSQVRGYYGDLWEGNTIIAQKDFLRNDTGFLHVRYWPEIDPATEEGKKVKRFVESGEYSADIEAEIDTLDKASGKVTGSDLLEASKARGWSGVDGLYTNFAFGNLFLFIDDNGNATVRDKNDHQFWTKEPSGESKLNPDNDIKAQNCDSGTEGCAAYSSKEFNSGTPDSPNAFFIKVSKGGVAELNGAILRDFITDGSVSYAAPVVVDGGAFNINEGSIAHNSVGYSADNTDKKWGAEGASMWQAQDIGHESEKGDYEEIEGSLLKKWANTETAGAIIYTNGASGVMNGGDITENRGDTGAIVVQGLPDKGEETQKTPDGAFSTFKMLSGTIDNNVGVHHSGGIYVFNGARVQMGAYDAEKEVYSGDPVIKNNFAWNKGGAVWASEEAYASGVFKRKDDGKASNKPVSEAAFVMYSGTIDNNMAVNRAGAIEVMSNHVVLVNGYITNNTSRVLGGAIYVEGDPGKMYQLYIENGEITNNSAVNPANANTSQRIRRIFGVEKSDPEGKPCEFTNNITSGEYITKQNNLGFRNGFWNSWGNGGGLWLCSQGGTAVIAVKEGADVVISGNTNEEKPAGGGDYGHGDDIYISLAGAGGNGLVVLDSGSNKFEIEETGEAVEENKRYTGRRYGLKETSNANYSKTTGVHITGNVASNGGGIAGNGTIAFGKEKNVYKAKARLNITKKWADGLNPEGNKEIKLILNLIDSQGNVIQPIDGYSVTLNGTPDVYNPNKEGNAKDQYGPSDVAYESDSYVAEMALPLTTVDQNNKVISLVKFEVNGKTYDPADDADLKTIYQALADNSGFFENAVLTTPIKVTEIVDGKEVDVKIISPIAVDAQNTVNKQPSITSYYDVDGNPVGQFGIYTTEFAFAHGLKNEVPKETYKAQKKWKDESGNAIGWPAGAKVTFELWKVPAETNEEDDATLVQQLTVAEDKVVTFDPVPVISDDSFHYEVREKVSGAQSVQEGVSTESDGTVTFTNKMTSKKPYPAEISFEALKTMSGRDLKEGEFTFELKDYKGNVIDTQSNDADGKVKFDTSSNAIKFNSAGTFKFTISEKLPEGVTSENPTKDGLTYDTTEKEILVYVVAKETADSTTYVINKVTVNGAEQKFNSQTTTINATVPATNGKVTENVISFGWNDPVTQISSGSVFTFDGRTAYCLDASKRIGGGAYSVQNASTINSYATTSSDVEKLKKVVYYGYPNGKTPEGYTEDEFHYATQMAIWSIVSSNTSEFNDVKKIDKLWTLAQTLLSDSLGDIPENAVSLYVYKHPNGGFFGTKEYQPILVPVVNASSMSGSIEVGFNNVYTPAKTKVKKTWVGLDGTDNWPAGKTATIKVYYVKDEEVLDSETIVLTESEPEKDTKNFDAVDGAEFVVEEAIIDGYTSHVTGDEKNGFTVANEENTKPGEEKASIIVKAKKSFNLPLTGKYDKAFCFELKGLNGAPLPANTLVYNNGEEVNFGEIVFEKEGVYTYEITEKKGDLKGVTYDEVVKKFTVTVKKVVASDKTSYVVTNIETNTDGVEVTATSTSSENIGDKGKVTDYTWGVNNSLKPVDKEGYGHNTGLYYVTVDGVKYPAFCMDYDANFAYQATNGKYDVTKEGDVESYLEESLGNSYDKSKAEEIKKLVYFGYPYDATDTVRQYIKNTYGSKYRTETERDMLFSYATNILIWDITNNGSDLPPSKFDGTVIGNIISQIRNAMAGKNVPDTVGMSTFVYEPTSTHSTFQPMVIFALNSSTVRVNAEFKNEYNEEPKVEKYVNKKVHDEIVNFDQEFTYDIMAYIPEDATEFSLTDTLVEGLEFADKETGLATTDAERAIVEIAVKDSNDSKVGTSVGVEGKALDTLKISNQEPKISGQTISIRVYDRAGNGIKPLSKCLGKWVQLTFKARIKDDYRSIDALKALGAKVSYMDTNANSWQTINDNSPVDGEIDNHEGMANKGQLTVKYGGNKSDSDIKTNTVTVKPETTKLKVEKTWANIGDKAWPDDTTTVTFGIFKQKEGQAEEKVQEVVLDKAHTSKTVEDLAKLKGVTYTAREIKVNDAEVTNSGTGNAGIVAAAIGDATQYIVKIIEEAIGGENAVVKAINSKPEIEKYVNKDVHADIVQFDNAFDYDILAYVPEGSTKVVLKDQLISQLKLNYQSEEAAINAIRPTVKAKGKTNNHNTGDSGTVSADGEEIADGVNVSVNMNAGMVEIEILNKNGALDGQWVQATISAVINPDDYNAVVAKLTGDNPDAADSSLNWANIKKAENKPVNSDKDHNGLLNKASYEVFVGANGTGDIYTNTVTVKPETEKVEAEKVWENLDNSTTWPEGVEEVMINVLNGTEVVDTIVLTADNPTGESKALPKLKDVVYKLDETTHVPGYSTTIDGKVVTNKEKENPEIGTTATDKVDGDHVAEAKESVTIVDKVTYSNLKVGKTYKVSGKLMDKATNKPLLVNGEEITAEKEFTAETQNGTVELEFTFDASALKGQRLVAFEYLYDNGKEIAIHTDIDDENQTVDIEKPEEEKYVNKDVDATLDTFDEPFTYDIMAYVTKDGKSLTITDTLVEALKFVDGDDVKVYDMGEGYDANNHKDTVKSDGDGVVDDAVATKVGQKLEVKIEDATALQGHWIKVTFKAEIKAEKYKKVQELIESRDTSDEQWAYIEDNGLVLIEKEHDGVPNKAEYKLTTVNDYTYDETTNTVTIEPKTTKLKVSKRWSILNRWPADTTVTFGLFRTKDGAETELKGTVGADGKFTLADENNADSEQATVELTTEKHDAVTVTGLPRLEGVTYTAREIKVANAAGSANITGEGNFFADVATGVGNAITEAIKYIVSLTTSLIGSGDDAYTEFIADNDLKVKTVISKVTLGGEELPGATIQILDKDGKVVKIDEESLEWTSTDTPREFYLDPGTYTMHEDAAPAGYALATDIEFTVNEDGTVTVGDARVDGNVVKMTDKLTSVKISKTDLGGTELPGATIQILDEEGNVVKLGDEQLEWVSTDTPKVIEGLPAGTYTLKETVAPEGYQVVETNVEFTVDESNNVKVEKVTEQYGDNDVVVTEVKDGDTVVLKDRPIPPATEKYVNKKVDAELDTFDEPFTYDIMAYVTMDGESLTITDTLVDALEFVNGGEVAVADMGEGYDANDHKEDGTVAKDGKDITKDADINVAGQDLTVKIAVAKPLRGHWIKVTFKAQIKADAYAAVKEFLDKKAASANGLTGDVEGEWANVAGDQNGLVLTEKEHDGVPNKAKYSLVTENGGTFENDTNTVTIEPTTTEITVKKTWSVAGENKWPANTTVTFGLYENDDELLGTVAADGTFKAAKADDNKAVQATVELSESKTELKVTGLPKLKGVTYKAKEIKVTKDGKSANVAADADGVQTAIIDAIKYIVSLAEDAVNGVYTATNELKVRVTFSKTDLGGTELDGAKMKVVDENGNEVSTWTSEAGKDHELYLDPGTYTMKEEVAPEGYLPVNTDMVFVVREDGTVELKTVTVDNGGKISVTEVGTENHIVLADAPIPPQTEKYVNKDVDATLESFDEPFTYDVMAYVSMDGVSLKITDTLVDALRFVETDKITVADMGAGIDANDHEKVVANDGADITESADIKAEGQNLEVKIADATSLRGHWIKVTFKAQIKAEAYAKVLALIGKRDASDAEWAEVTDNGLVVNKAENHDGIPNTAKYTLETKTGGTFEEDTNTVTIEPKTTEVKVSKEWLLDDEATEWPAGATVEVILRAEGEGAAEAGVDGSKAVLDKDQQSYTFTDLPLVSTVKYSVLEGEVRNGGAFTFGQVENLGDGVFKITNRKYTPEIEKYVNKKTDDLTDPERDGTVHTDLSAFDEVYTYDIQAYITPDARYVEVIDELRSVLEFAGDGPTAVIVKEGSAKNAPKLTAAGEALENYTVDAEAWKTGKLILTLGSDAEDAKVLPEAGKWLQITFDARIRSNYKSLEALEAAGVTVWTEIEENDPIDDADVVEVFSGAETGSHVGIVNDTYYNINKLKVGAEVDGIYQYSDRSNVVTVRPPTTEVYFSKTNLDGDELPGAKMKLTDAEGNVIDEWTSTTDDHVLNLVDGEYIMTEEVAPEGYYCVTTKMRFVIRDGVVTLLTAEVDNDGQIEVLTGNIIILKDAPKVKGVYEREKPKKDKKKTTTSEVKTKTKTVETGDNTMIYIWTLTLILSICAAAIAAMIRRRRSVR